jgi:hypothetical protein
VKENHCRVDKPLDDDDDDIYIQGYKRSRGSSVSIISGYGMDDRAIDIRSLAQARGFFL